MDNSILICIFNYRQDENARRWYNLLSPHFETYVLDSGNNKVCEDFIQFPNIYYSGLFNEVKKLSSKKDYKWIGIICSDVIIDDFYIERFINCINWLSMTTNVGMWQAAPDESSRSVHGHITYDCLYQYKKWIEGWMQFTRKDVFDMIPEIDTNINQFGWNIDTVAAVISYYKKLCVLMDNRCKVHHPADRGYPEDSARAQGKAWEKIVLSELNMKKMNDTILPIYSDIKLEYKYDISFIIPIRGREDMKKYLERNLNYIFSDYSYEIIYVEQDNDDLFRLGQLRNIGAMAAQGKYIIIQDVDIIHLRKIDLKKIADEVKDCPIRLFNRISQLTYTSENSYEITLTERRGGTGACVLFTREAWNKWNGYSNIFRGWGSEDDTFREYSKIKTYAQDLGHISHERMINKNPEATEKNKDIYFNYILKNKINHYDDGYRQELYKGERQCNKNISIIKVKEFGISNRYKYSSIYKEYDSLESKNTIKYVIYTAVTNNYDSYIQQPYIKNCKFVYFTDNIEQFKNVETSAEIIEIPDRLKYLSPVKQQRYIKTHPHEFFKEYDYSIWIDGNMEVLTDPISLIDKNYIIEIPRHPYRNCIYNEAEACIRLKKDSKEIIEKQIKEYKDLNYPKNQGLVQTNIIIRKHNDKKCIKLMEDWWKEIEEHSCRDQLSFNFVLWKNKNIKFKYLDKNIYKSSYLNWHVKHKKDIQDKQITTNFGGNHDIIRERIIEEPVPKIQEPTPKIDKIIQLPTPIKRIFY